MHEFSFMFVKIDEKAKQKHWKNYTKILVSKNNGKGQQFTSASCYLKSGQTFWNPYDTSKHWKYEPYYYYC